MTPRKSLITSEQVLTALADTPLRIAALTAALGPDQLHAPPGDGGWSAHEVLAHLRACADMWGACIAAMIAQDTPTLRAVNPRTWIKKTDYLDQDFRPLLHTFATQRAELLALLGPLEPEGWARAATVTVAGKPLERTVLFYARWMAGHEGPHLKQVDRIVGTLRQSH